MTGYVTNIEEKTQQNSYFREVLFTGPNSQLVVMALAPGEEIGLETHDNVDQFIRVETGTGKAILNGKEYDLWMPAFAGMTKSYPAASMK